MKDQLGIEIKLGYDFKQCRTCHFTKPIREFRKDILSHQCKQCRNAQRELCRLTKRLAGASRDLKLP